ncbi:MAG: cbb3-type cytochrome c oxidase subunit II [Verrucomicrobiota bacterium]
MNRAPLIFLGVFFALAFSWTGIILVNQISYGRLTPVYDENDNIAYPQALPGIAQQGRLVYEDLGCIYCHTQQVRRPGYGADIERGWGERQSVARDYIREPRVFLGTMRTGPDLRNVGARYVGDAGAEWHHRHLYDPQITSPGSNMPPFKFLYETRKIVGEPSVNAITHLLPEQYQPEAGYEIVPTKRAESLVAYLLSLQDTYAYPETNNVYTEPAPEEKADGEKTAESTPAAEPKEESQ